MRHSFCALAATSLLAACSPEVGKTDEAVLANANYAPTEISDAAVTIEDTVYNFVWESSVSETPVRIEMSTDPDFKPGEGEIILSGDISSGAAWLAPDLSKRRWFQIIPEVGEPVEVASRVLPLEGGRNFRALGGYATEDGRTIKWGRLFRSGIMSGLTDADYQYLSSIGIRTVCDFRAASERASEPTDWKAGDAEYLFWADPEGGTTSGFGAVFRDPELTPEKVAQAFADSYLGIALQQAPAYADMFDRLAAGDTPLSFNCTAGKDRTGIAAALILTVLGVPRETIVEDYAMSDDVVDYMNEFSADQAKDGADADPVMAFFKRLPPELIAPIMASDPYYIETFFADVEAEYGSVDAFLKQAIAVTDDEIAAIRSELLE